MAKITTGQIAELIAQSDKDIITRENFQTFLENPSRFLEKIDVALVPEGWKIVEDVPPSKFQIKNLKLVSFLEKGEDYVKGEVMRERAVGFQANLGLADLKFILNHQDEIPAEFKNKHLVFAGILLRNLDGNLDVTYLCWDDDRWCLNFYWIGYGWGGNSRLVSCK